MDQGEHQLELPAERRRLRRDHAPPHSAAGPKLQDTRHKRQAMTNREQIIDRMQYEVRCKTMLGKEVEELMEIWAEDEDAKSHDYANAFEQVLESAERCRNRIVTEPCTSLLIDYGFYRKRTGEVAMTGRDRSPVRAGQRYDPACSLSEWLSK